MNSWPEVMNVSQIQSHQQSQVYTFRANSQFDGSYLRLLQNRVTAELLVHKASKRLIVELHIEVDFVTTNVQQIQAVYHCTTCRLLQLLQLFGYQDTALVCYFSKFQCMRWKY